MTFYLGCAVWSYDGWLGNFYPPKTPKKAFLNLYSQRFLTVEGNTTFYAVPSEANIQRWREETTSAFKFCLKFPKEITHQGQLMPYISDALTFIKRVQQLEDKLGLLFLQLPPNYSPHYQDDLQQFLKGLKQTNIALAVEVRHLDWFRVPYQNNFNNLLRDLNITRVILDTRPVYRSPDDPQINSPRKKPDVPVNFTLTNNHAFVRFISHPNLTLNELYLAEWTQKVQQWLAQNITVYFFVHCPIEDHSPFTARHFYHKLQAIGADVPTLPWDALAEAPQQLSLF
ncbi:MAG: DUF72 domain-containing protein [Snowella sp.]|nr:DUF72 domain-containing protein [Snowella sp.]